MDNHPVVFLRCFFFGIPYPTWEKLTPHHYTILLKWWWKPTHHHALFGGHKKVGRLAFDSEAGDKWKSWKRWWPRCVDFAIKSVRNWSKQPAPWWKNPRLEAQRNEDFFSKKKQPTLDETLVSTARGGGCLIDGCFFFWLLTDSILVFSRIDFPTFSLPQPLRGR